MATIKEELGVEKIYETVKSTKCILAKLKNNPDWVNTFNQEIDEFVETHNSTECVALQAALSSHVFLPCDDELSTLPISDDFLARCIGTCDINQKFSWANVVSPFNSRF